MASSNSGSDQSKSRNSSRGSQNRRYRGKSNNFNEQHNEYLNGASATGSSETNPEEREAATSNPNRSKPSRGAYRNVNRKRYDNPTAEVTGNRLQGDQNYYSSFSNNRSQPVSDYVANHLETEVQFQAQASSSNPTSSKGFRQGFRPKRGQSSFNQWRQPEEHSHQQGSFFSNSIESDSYYANPRHSYTNVNVPSNPPTRSNRYRGQSYSSKPVEYQREYPQSNHYGGSRSYEAGGESSNGSSFHAFRNQPSDHLANNRQEYSNGNFEVETDQLSKQRPRSQKNNGNVRPQDQERPLPSGFKQSSNYRTNSSKPKYDFQSWKSESFNRKEEQKKKLDEATDHATQRERLTSHLTSGVYECMVCCESVQPVQAIWNCSQCFHVFHLNCVRRWARSSQDESGQWRCPGCQSVNKEPVSAYYCFCCKRKDPEWNRRDIPHSCGEVCGKPLGDGSECVHNCTLLCHPGPCPSCSAQTNRNCACGKTSQMMKCGSAEALLCDNPCGKMLECGLHSCSQNCHKGPCESCTDIQTQVCYCSQELRQMPCSADIAQMEHYPCGKPCQKKLECGNHSCDQLCHPGPCGSCRLQVSLVTTCPCRKKALKELYETGSKVIRQRSSCTDPVPVCGQICGKILPCGPAENRHPCPVLCHEGPCPPCKLSTVLKCRCGRSDKKIQCRHLPATAETTCERRCNKKRQCGRHKCVNVCCVDAEHICPLVCGRQLSCGRDRCEALCHTGNCSRCYRVSFDELRCFCGTQVTYPPVACGARPPDCNRPCTQTRPCGHQPQHNCHPEAACPPCTVLCEKLCYGQHEVRKNVPCHLTVVSCGKPCGKPLPCGRHTCPMTCHDGACPVVCSQPCPAVRAECSHPCNVACHDGACPPVACREKVKVQCQCGIRAATVSCEEQQSAFKKMATGLLASKMAALQSGECVDFKDLLGPNGAANKTKSLECNEECALVERNRRLALALQIQNPNPKPGAPRYPDLLKDWVKKDPRFTQMVHDKISELVQLAKQSVGKMKSRSHSFDPMNRDKRQFVHEYAAFFGCESASYDEEPKRNVVVTAYGDTCYLPAIGVLDVTRREMGQRKMPGPPQMKGVAFTVLVPAAQQQQSQQQQQQQQPSQPKPSAWGKNSAGTFRTLSDVVKNIP